MAKEIVSTRASSSTTQELVNHAAHPAIYGSAVTDNSPVFVNGDVIARLTGNSVAGDTSSSIGTTTLSGDTFNNTDEGILYYTLAYSTATGTAATSLTLYKDSTKAATSAVSAGLIATTGTMTLAASYSSGLTGTVVFDHVLSSTATAVSGTITTSQVNFQKYDLTGSNQVVVGVVEEFSTADKTATFIKHGVVRYSMLNVTNGTGKEDELTEALQAIGIYVI